MNQTVESILTWIVPRFIRKRIWSFVKRINLVCAKKRFEGAAASPEWLDVEKLETLQEKYPLQADYKYDPESTATRGKERADEILDLIRSDSQHISTFLELACYDGMVLAFLQRQGKQTTGIDLNRLIDERAISDGVQFQQMNVHEMAFENASFDFVFSYNGFEHFSYPDKVLQEAIRVVRRGGYLYLNFSPLYMSPMGLHAYRSISVPYCQFLFPSDMLENYVKANRLDPLELDQLNRWSIEKFRDLWKEHSQELDTIMYHESISTSNLDIVKRYPSCFRSKTDCFDHLIVSGIKVLFQKR